MFPLKPTVFVAVAALASLAMSSLTASAATLFNYNGVCDGGQCNTLTEGNPNAPVTGFLLLSDDALVAGAVLNSGDLIDWGVTFGTRSFPSSGSAITTSFSATIHATDITRLAALSFAFTADDAEGHTVDIGGVDVVENYTVNLNTFPEILITGNNNLLNGSSGTGPGGSSRIWVGTGEQVAAVPLPAALPLLGGALSLLGFIGWRRKRLAVG